MIFTQQKKQLYRISDSRLHLKVIINNSRNIDPFSSQDNVVRVSSIEIVSTVRQIVFNPFGRISQTQVLMGMMH